MCGDAISNSQGSDLLILERQAPAALRRLKAGFINRNFPQDFGFLKYTLILYYNS